MVVVKGRDLRYGIACNKISGPSGNVTRHDDEKPKRVTRKKNGIESFSMDERYLASQKVYSRQGSGIGEDGGSLFVQRLK